MRMTHNLSVTLICLLALLSAPAAMAQPSTGYSLSQDAVALLQDLLPSGHSRTDRNLENAIEADSLRSPKVIKSPASPASLGSPGRGASQVPAKAHCHSPDFVQLCI